MVANYFLGVVAFLLTTGRQCNVLIQEAVKTIGNAVGLILICGFIFFCAIAACVITKRRRQRAILKRLLQLQSQHQPPSRPRILVRRSPVTSNMENITSNPELNRNVPRTETNEQEPVTHGSTSHNTPVSLPEPVTQDSTPHNTPALLSEPVGPFAPPPYTLGSHFQPVAPPLYTPASQFEPASHFLPPLYTPAFLTGLVTPVAPLYTPAIQFEPASHFLPPPYTPAFLSGPVTPVAPPPYTPSSPSVPPPPYSENI